MYTSLLFHLLQGCSYDRSHQLHDIRFYWNGDLLRARLPGQQDGCWDQRGSNFWLWPSLCCLPCSPQHHAHPPAVVFALLFHAPHTRIWFPGRYLLPLLLHLLLLPLQLTPDLLRWRATTTHPRCSSGVLYFRWCFTNAKLPSCVCLRWHVAFLLHFCCCVSHIFHPLLFWIIVLPPFKECSPPFVSPGGPATRSITNFHSSLSNCQCTGLLYICILANRVFVLYTFTTPYKVFLFSFAFTTNCKHFMPPCKQCT